jgi:photosystem II stability/assembly factor-like uncharacterized protein
MPDSGIFRIPSALAEGAAMAKATTTKARARRTGPPQRRPALPGWALATGAVALVLGVAAVVWAIGRGDDEPAGSVTIEHVHGLGVNPANSVLYAATHDGVFRLPPDGPARRVGEGRQDTMGFTVAGPDHFLASGHPAESHGGPAHLGLIESTDAGVTWRTLSLRGGADFHALRFRHNIVYGYNAVTGQLMVSRDKATWDTRATIALRDLVVSPSSPDILVATGQRGVLRSSDGGRTWTPAGGPPVVLLDWQRDDRLWGVTANGELLRSTDGGTAWSPAGHVAGPATAFAAHNDDLYVAVHERGIFRSRDVGATWTQLHP